MFTPLTLAGIYIYSQCSVSDHTLKQGISNCAPETLHHDHMCQTIRERLAGQSFVNWLITSVL